MLKSARLSHPGQYPFDNYYYLLGKQKCRILTNTRLPPLIVSVGHLLEVPAPGSSLGGCSHLQVWVGMIAVWTAREVYSAPTTVSPVRPTPGLLAVELQYYKDSNLHHRAPPCTRKELDKADTIHVYAFCLVQLKDSTYQPVATEFTWCPLCTSLAPSSNRTHWQPLRSQENAAYTQHGFTKASATRTDVFAG